MDTWEVAAGLWHWAAPHPEWEPGAEPESVGDWPELVGCAIAEIGDGVVIVDPLVTEDGWAWLDERVAGRPAHVLTTNPAHGRSGAEVLARYGADEAAPRGVRLFPIGVETLVWLEPYRTLVTGDRIIGGREPGTLRRCPPSWSELPDAVLREALQPLLALDVECVLVSHGESLFDGAGPALAAAIEAPADRAV